MDNSSAIRTAAILYADDNQKSTQKTIHRKIIESIFVSVNNGELSIHQIIDKIKEQLELIFDENEVENIVHNDKKGNFDVRFDNKCEVSFIKMNNRRYELLKEKENTNNISIYIGQHVSTMYSGEISKDEVEVIIYKYVYELLNKNISAFKKITSSKYKAEDISISAELFNNKQREAINGFLNWDNPIKNKSLFKVISYAIEYSLISNNIDNSNLSLDSLRNKIFYLDNNVIYRIIGINGEDRKRRMMDFVRKCKDSGQSFVVSKYTVLEFKETVKYHITQLQRVQFKRINPKIFAKYAINSDIYQFYHSWRSSKNSYGFDQFNAHIVGLYKDFINEFNIEEDYRIPFDEQDKAIKNTIEKYANEIAISKKGNGNNGSHVYDAKNTFLVEKKRGENSKNISDTKYFFVSVDQKLRNWDFQRNDNQPIALLPSQWMSIILKYFARTDDDFKSFMSFLKFNIDEPTIQGDKLQVILAGISEITEDFEKQESIFERMLEVKFDKILDGNSFEEIKDQATEFAQKLMDDEITALKLKHEETLNEYESKIASKEKESNSKAQILKDELILDITESITELEKTKKTLDKIVLDNYKHYLFDIGLGVVGYYSALFIATCIFTWNVMEPFTYFLGTLGPILGYFYFAVKHQEFNIITYFKKLQEEETEVVYKKYGFNFDRLNKLIEQKNELTTHE